MGGRAETKGTGRSSNTGAGERRSGRRLRRRPTSIWSLVTTLVVVGVLVGVLAGGALAASTGPNHPGTAASDSSNGSSQAWSNLTNALTQNDLYADATVNKANPTTQYLKLTNFGFSIATDAVIDGIQVEVDRYTSTGQIIDQSVKLVKGGTIGGTEKSGGAAWPTSDTDAYVSYGGSADLWGQTWTAADINSANFGIAIAATKPNSGNSTRDAHVDDVRVTVTYHGNQAPTDISLSSTSIPEDAGANATVGTFSTTDLDVGNTFTYTLVSGTGSTDNGSFNISGNTLRANASFDYETKSSYSIRARSTDQGGLYLEKQFTINVTNVNEAPTLDSITNKTTQWADAVTLTAVGHDPDAGTTLTYGLSAGAPGSINPSTGAYHWIPGTADIGVHNFNVTVSDGSFSAQTAVQITVTTRAITVTAASGNKAYDGTTSSAGAPTLTAGTLAAGDIGHYSQTFATPDAGTGKTLTPAAIIRDAGANDVTSSYTVTLVNNATGVINPIDATLDIQGWTGPYDGTAHGAILGHATGVGGVDLSAHVDLGDSFTDTPGGTAHWTFSFGPNYNDASGDAIITIDPAPATVTLDTGSLSATYDGHPHHATASTTPPGLTVDITYSQGGGPVTDPTEVGSYDVTATIDETNYTGSTTGTMVISPASVTSPSITSLNPTGGTTAGGTSVIIMGTNFTGATAVTFGGLSATSFVFDSDTQITAVAPAHAAATVQVQVTTPGGSTADTAASHYTYSAPLSLTRYEDSDHSLSYNGWWLSYATSVASGGRFSYTDILGASVTVRFNGTYLAWIAKTSPLHGIAKVTLDDRAPVMVDLYSSATLFKQKVWETPAGLSSGDHALIIECTRTGRPAATDTNINIDALDILGTLTDTEGLDALPAAGYPVDLQRNLGQLRHSRCFLRQLLAFQRAGRFRNHTL